MTHGNYAIVFDGGSLGNPGRGYGSFALRSVDGAAQPTGWQIKRLTFPGRVTNNEAEYDTLIAALQSLVESLRVAGRDPAQTSVDVRGDSLLVISQVTRRWKAHEPRMADRRDAVIALANQFQRVSFVHQPRSQSVKILGH
jgi:ribonuclease HI